MKKTVLILYSQRYDTSALAIKEYLDEQGRYDVIAVPDTAYDNFMAIKTYHALYKFTYRNFPFFNNLLINLPSAEAVRKKDSDGNIVPFKPNSETYQRWRKFDNISMRFDADYVICTTQYAIRKSVIAREKYILSGKIYALMTDFALQDNFVNHDIDGYFVVTNKTKHSLVAKGVDENKVYVINMPLAPRSALEIDKEQIRKEFNIRNDHPVVTLIGGRFGSKYLFDTLLRVCQYDDCNIAVVTGGNKFIKSKFEKWSKKHESSYNVYFDDGADGLERIYAVTDYLITSPTCAICYEAMLRKIPVVLMDSVNNVETKNSRYLVSCGFAYSGISRERLDISIEKCRNERDALANFCEKHFKDNGCEQFARSLDMIDEGVDPNEYLLQKNEEVVKVDEIIKTEEPIKEKKHKRRFFRK